MFLMYRRMNGTCPLFMQTDERNLSPVHAPVVISSGYRCPALNRAVGGVPNSQHLKGEAADIVMPKLADAFYWLIDNTPFDQLGFESKGSTKWIHVSCKLNPSENRQCIFRKTV